MRTLVVGGGGFCKELWNYWTGAQGRPPDGVLDDNPACLDGTPLAGHWVGPIASFQPFPTDNLILAIGTPEGKRKVADLLGGRGARWTTLIHPTAVVSPHASLEAGVIVGPFAYVGPGAQLAELATLNTYASVGHDAIVGRRAILSPYASLNGHARLGEDAFLGSHATVSPRVTVGSRSKVSAGSVVLRDLSDGSLAIGNPAQGRVMFR